jgi:hypothetical protein
MHVREVCIFGESLADNKMTQPRTVIQRATAIIMWIGAFHNICGGAGMLDETLFTVKNHTWPGPREKKHLNSAGPRLLAAVR